MLLLQKSPVYCCLRVTLLWKWSKGFCRLQVLQNESGLIRLSVINSPYSLLNTEVLAQYQYNNICFHAQYVNIRFYGRQVLTESLLNTRRDYLRGPSRPFCMLYFNWSGEQSELFRNIHRLPGWNSENVLIKWQHTSRRFSGLFQIKMLLFLACRDIIQGSN